MRRPGDTFGKAREEAGAFRPVLEILGSDYPDLLRASEPAPVHWSAEQVKKLLQAVRAEAPPKRSFTAQRRILEVIEAGNNEGVWHVPIVQVPAPLPPPPKPVFSHDGFDLAVRYQGLPDAFVETLRFDGLEPKMIWGQVLLSSLLFGGLLQPKSLWAFGDAIPGAPAHLHWVEWQDGESGGHRVHRHFVDPLTRLLALHWRRREWPARTGARVTRQLFRSMYHYAKAVGLDGYFPPDWTTLRKVAETRLALYVPPHLIGVATGFYHPTSLPPHVMERLTVELGPVQPPTAGTAAQAEGEQGPSDPGLVRTGGSADSEGPTEEWPETAAADIRRIGSILRNAPSDQRAQLQAMVEHTRLASVRRLARWARDGLLMGSHGRKALSSMTAYDHFNAIAEPLVGQLADDDPVHLNNDDRVDLYATAIEDTDSPGARNRVLKGLREFQAYLERTHEEVPPLPDGDLFSAKGQKPTAVDANLIEPESFEWVLTWLELFGDGDAESNNLSILMAVLGYYAGMRRSEVAGLRIGDLEGPPSWDLVIRPHSLRRLKSQSAARVAPLNALLPTRHLQRLIRWWEVQRQAADDLGKDWREWLLFDPIRPAEGVTGNDKGERRPEQQKGWIHRGGDYMRRIREALYRVTGDPGLRFHHLRHSFANRLLLAMWQAECDRADEDTRTTETSDPLNEPLPEWARGWIGQEPWSLRSQLLGESSAQRRSLMAIARMLGHSSPDITMGHYIHLADLVLSRAMRRLTPTVPEPILTALTGLDETERRQWRRETGSGKASDYLDRIGDGLLAPEQRLQRLSPQSQRVLAHPEHTKAAAWLLTDVLIGRYEGAAWLESFAPPWLEQQLAHWESLLTTVPEHLRVSRHGKKADAPIERPATQQDVNRARQTLEWLETRPESEQVDLIEAYRNGRLERNPLDVAFPSAALARAWSDLIDHLDLNEAVDFYVVPAPWESTEERDSEIAFWREQTKIALVYDPQFRNLLGPELNQEEGGVVCCHRKGAGDSRGYWVYGVQWAFLMAWLLRQ
ncbi:site-specific integrase [Thiohalospira halophila]|uniref:hypothetical protein n=1 Tax=Thiohalospira halophila TaxID=381300 RepID=UPI001356606D|nr:hypothetical protein [Thiohalospira halophila]